ncbi:MAG: hypothetical protein FJX54_23195 [Alphaproteobacteria bacterium]|nr:hypothetical protein [Alphaproteobacteria bacterium]
MSSTGELSLPPPKTWDAFEAILLSAARIRWASAEFFRHGRQGPRMDGVDVYGSDAKGRMIGIQGQHSMGGVPEDLIKEEVARGESVVPALHQLFLATTVKRDTSLQQAMRLLSRHRTADRKFGVDILFWEDIVRELAKDEAVLRSHYPEIKPAAAAPAAAPPPPAPNDAALFGQFLALLPPDGAIAVLDRTNMAGASFPRSTLDPLTVFLRDWNRRDRVFADAEIEAAKQLLWEKVKEYLQVVAGETVLDKASVSVPEAWEKDQPERFWRVSQRLNRLAEELVERQGTLMQVAGRKLG